MADFFKKILGKNSTSDQGTNMPSNRHPSCQFQFGPEKAWLDLQYNKDRTIKKPKELEKAMEDPPGDIDRKLVDRIQGSMLGMAIGDALGASVEFQPHQYLVQYPVTDFQQGGTWSLQKGQFTDDTSMGLCLAISLIVRQGYDPYDQLVRYKWWHQYGYMSSTGECFDIGKSTKQSLAKFRYRQEKFAENQKIPIEDLDYLSDERLLNEFKVDCGDDGAAGNGALMRLAPVPLFFHRFPVEAVKYSVKSGSLTHRDRKSCDACRYYAALIVAAVEGRSKEEILDPYFYEKNKEWFGKELLHEDILTIMRGSYQKDGYKEGIRGKGYVVNSLEAALWAFWSDGNSFEKGACNVVNLGDDTDTTAAIYGQLAGAHYGSHKINKEWIENLYAHEFIKCISKWITYEGQTWSVRRQNTSSGSTNRVNSLHENESIQRGTKYSNPQSHAFKDEADDWKSMEKMNTKLSKFTESPRPQQNTIDDATDKTKLYPTQQASTVRRSSTTESQKIYSDKSLETCEDVCKWAENFGEQYRNVVNAFKRYDLDGYWLLNHVNDETLERYGVTDKRQQQFVLEKISEMKKNCTVLNVVDPDQK